MLLPPPAWAGLTNPQEAGGRKPPGLFSFLFFLKKQLCTNVSAGVSRSVFMVQQAGETISTQAALMVCFLGDRGSGRETILPHPALWMATQNTTTKGNDHADEAID